MISLLLVFSANIVTMAKYVLPLAIILRKALMGSDLKAIKAWNHLKSAGTNGTEEIDWDCEYVEYSTVPDQTGGPFWSILNRLFICTSPSLLL